MSQGGGERTPCPVSGTCRGRQISRCPPAVCNRIFQAAAGSLWGNFVRRHSQIRVNAAQRFIQYTGRSGSLSLPPRWPALSAQICHKGFLPPKLSSRFWQLQQTNCCLQSWQALWSPNELAFSAQMRKKLQNQFISWIRGDERRTNQARVSVRSNCAIYILSSNCSLLPNRLMAASLPSKPLYDRHCNVFSGRGSIWLGQQYFSPALSDSGTRSSHLGHSAINHPAGTAHHFLSSYQFLQGTKRPLWAFGQPKLLLSLRILRFMSNAELNLLERHFSPLWSNFNEALTKLQLIATKLNTC